MKIKYRKIERQVRRFRVNVKKDNEKSEKQA
jgi:hypothetical protein